jgi:hypothetical protein
MQTSFFDVIYLGPWVASQENLRIFDYFNSLDRDLDIGMGY